jgi:hypothetical protein
MDHNELAELVVSKSFWLYSQFLIAILSEHFISNRCSKEGQLEIKLKNVL